MAKQSKKSNTNAKKTAQAETIQDTPVETAGAEKKNRKDTTAGNGSKRKDSPAVLAIGADRRRIRTIRILAFLIPVIAVLLGMLAGSFAPFGGKDVMTAGGNSAHLTYYYELYDRVHEGKGLIYSLTSGSGYDFSTIFTYYLSDPLNLIILIFPRTAILAVINLLYALKIGLAGLFFSMFLTRRKARIEAAKASMEEQRADAIAAIAERREAKKAKAIEKAEKKGSSVKKDLKIGGSETPQGGLGALLSSLDLPNLGFSTAFALSAYMLGQGLNVAHLSVVVIFPLLLMALEDLLSDGKWKLYAALMTASVFFSFPMAIIVFIFSILYAAVFEYKDLHHAIRNLLLKLISDLLATGAGAVIILNCVGSTAFQSATSIKFPLGGYVTTFFDVVKCLLPTAQTSSTSIYTYGIDIFCGFLAVFLFVLYIMNPNISLSRRIRQTALLVITGGGFVLVTPNYLLNGFTHPEMTTCLFGFLFVVQLLSMAYEAMLNLEHTPAWQIHLSLLLLSGLIVLSFLHCDNYDSFGPFLYAWEFLTGYYVLTILFRSNSITKWLLFSLIPVALIAELGMTYIDNLRMTGSRAEVYEKSMDGQFYEASRIVHKAMPNAHIKIYDPDNNEDTPVTTTLMNYHFVLAKKGDDTVDATLKHLTDYEDVSIYENNYSAECVFVPKKIDDWIYLNNYAFTCTNDLTANVLGLSPVFYNAPGTFDNGLLPRYDENGIEDIRRADYLFTYQLQESGDLYNCLYGIRHLGKVNAGDYTSFTRTIASWETLPYMFQSEFAFFYLDGFEDMCNSLTVASEGASTEGRAAYQITVPEDGYVLLPFSDLSGWKATVNGKTPDSTSSFLDRGILIPVNAGENTVEITYSPILFYIGIAISLAALAILIWLALKDHLKIRAGASGINTISEWILENRVYLLSLAAVTLVFVYGLMASSSIPFGDRSVLVGDGYLQGYYGYKGLIDSVKSGTFSPVDWNIGMAIDQYPTFLGYLMSPWTLLKFLFLPESLTMSDLAYGYYLTLIMSAFSIIFYLTHRRRGPRMKKTDWRLILISVSYSLSTFAINYFIYNGFGFLYYAPFLILGMERLVYDKKPALYIVMLFLQMGDAYYAFIFCEFLALYFFTMEFESIKDFIRKGLRFAAASIVAVGLACFRLIPYFMRTLESPYLELDSASPAAKSSGSFLSVIADYMNFREPVITSTDDYRVNYYIGMLALLIIPLYLMNQKIKLSVRIRRSVLLGLYFVAFGSSILNYVFHGFHFQSQVPNRFAAFFMVLLIIMFHDCLLSWKNYSRKSFCFGISIPAVLLSGLWCIQAFTTKNTESIALIMSLSFVGIYLILAILQLRKKISQTARRFMVGLCLLEVLLNALYTFPHCLGAITPDTTDRTSINALAERNPEMKSPFTATEYMSDYYNIAEATDITSDSFFTSTSTNGHMRLFIKWNMLTSGNSTFYLAGNPLADMMLHVRYNLSNDMDDTSWSRYPIIDRHGVIELHENPYFLPLGIFFRNSDELTAWDKTDYSDYVDHDNGNAFEFQNAFSHAMGCGDIYHIIEPEADESKINPENDSDITYITADPSAFEEGKQSEIPTQIHLAKDVEGDIYFSYFNNISYAGTTSKGVADVFDMTMYLPLGKNDYYMRIAVCDQEELKKLYQKLSEFTMQNIDINFTTISGTINSPQDGTVYLSLPEMKAWSAYVDGKQVEISSFLGGIGIPVTAGEHNIEIVYTPRGVWLGLAISLAVLVLLIAFAIIHAWLMRRNAHRSDKTDVPEITSVDDPSAEDTSSKSISEKTK